ncbi:threonine-phosphate decarboxylase CobD [Planococcus shenhongbingii]|uniref:threonine-phosphate decarboxylase CobD n=1 Tax=Planococcus shenhongbingii TaxID=3058398 RepID=UPI002628BEC2|nr:threonine-phosphate decarboxylase CobD [Planococcus sp. N016]WKA57912.1 threonine-phosphate decarboxylase CobD [Planococcus sp. N016]
MNLPDHGANPKLLYKRLRMEAPEWILDFSENVHPFGPPEFIDATWKYLQELIKYYPDPDGEPFRSAAAKFHGVEPDRVIAGNGAAEIFTWLAHRYRGKRVLLIEPAFSEYRKTLEAEGAEVVAVQLTEESGWRLQLEELVQALKGCAAVYICNPHNPTGLLLQQHVLVSIAEECRNAGCELVLDEAFIDFAGEKFSLIPLQKTLPHIIIVRSMTKMYAIPGLRLGYAIGEPKVLKQLKRGAAHWNVNAISAQIGARCLEQQAYRVHVVEAAGIERESMTRFLEEKGCAVTDSAVNFLSFRLPADKAPDVFFNEMLRKGIVLRHTRSFKGMDGNWFRIGMKSAVQMQELREAITQWLRDN